MRERERKKEKERENPHHPHWTTVHRRKPKPRSHLASKTCYVDFLPTNICPYDIARTFEPYGPIVNISITEKIIPHRSHRFPFVQFFSSASQQMAIKGENGRKLAGGRLGVFAAKNDTSKTFPNHRFQAKPLSSHTHVPHSKPPPPRNNAYRDHRTYKEASLNTNFKPKPRAQNQNQPKQNYTEFQAIPNQDQEPMPECFYFAPTPTRRASSRILGDVVEKTRDELTVEEFEDEKLITIKGAKSPENEELYSRSVLALAASSLSSSQIHQNIL